MKISNIIFSKRKFSNRKLHLNDFAIVCSLLLLFIYATTNAQCTTGSEAGTVFTPNYSGDAEVISANTANGFYTKVNILPNRYYTFIVMISSQPEAGYQDFITITNETGTVVYASGFGILRWSSGTNTGIIRYYNHLSSNCLTVPNNRTKMLLSSESLCLPPTSYTSSTLDSSSVSLSWNSSVSTPSDGYEYYVSSSSAYPSNTASQVVTGATANTYALLTNLDNSLGYTWWVRSNCGNIRSTWTKAGSFSICTPPQMTNISNIGPFSAKLNWQTPDPDPYYGYQYAMSTINATPTTWSSTTTNTVNFTGLLSGTVYYYWLRSNCDADNQSSWVSGSFTTDTVYCTNAVYGLRPQATFTPACTGSWEEISDNSYFGEYCNVVVQPNTNYIFGIDYLEINGVYTPGYVTITNEDASVNHAGGIGDLEWFSGNNSGIIRFYLHRNALCNFRQEGIGKYVKCYTTLNVDNNEMVDVKLFPNPTTDFIHLVSRQSIDKIEITNPLGQIIKSEPIQSKEYTANLSAIAAGTYFVKILAENTSKVYKVIKK
ncbi:T9SS type A sorting domain-containing protein [Flavobacterium sp. CYK-4]|uniref:T9SS type A sorting domain-containing protein n=1 Tax=Flavobacterium lotistagni TaxID=2709660 RepID=UPI001408DDCD|nr:T9SS type A sorting domain-containing protein [Flavobacterium lotistagni]NHM07909.1 T9SS type A sorting domain-containing protein [Flavobacterium lotistagni]